MSSPRGDALRQLASQLAALAGHQERVQAFILCTLGSLPSALSTTRPSLPQASASSRPLVRPPGAPFSLSHGVLLQALQASRQEWLVAWL